MKNNLINKKNSYGIWSILPNQMVTDVLSSSGLDFIFIDLEHGSFSLEQVLSSIQACEINQCMPIVRIPTVDNPITQNVLDLGAGGVIFPQIKSVADVQKAIESTMFYPKGTRGFNPFTRSGNYTGKKDSKESKRLENDYLFRGIILETEGACADLDQIIQIPNLNFIYLGVYDMSLALGCNGDVSHPKVIRFVEESTQKIKNAGIQVGAMFKTEEEKKWLQKIGVNMLTYGVDTWVLKSAIQKAIQT